MHAPEVHLTLHSQQPGSLPAQDSLVGVPQMYLQSLIFVVSQDDFPKGDPAVFLVMPLTTEGGFYYQDSPAQPTPPPDKKPPLIFTSDPRVERRVLSASMKRTLAAGSSEPFEDLMLIIKLQKMELSGAPLNISERIAPGLSLQKPNILNTFEDEVPQYMRQLYLSLFLEEYLKFASSDQEAQKKAHTEEKVVYDGSPSKDAYLSNALNTLRKLKGLAPSLVRGLNRAALYSCLRGYLLTEEELKVNGYPFPHPQTPGDAVLFTAQEKSQDSRPTCSRCGSKYDVSSYSEHRICVENVCYYHWGRIWQSPAAGPGKSRYSCCWADLGSQGCSVAMQHVQDGRKENLQGFVKTSVKPLLGDAHPGIYALDCEMCYTTQGLELTRVTVVDAEMRMVYDTFVKPDNEIIDYNTRFSGVTEEDLAFTSTTLQDVQAVLLNLFSADTILVGHSLECDLLALKMIHSTVVDTAVLFQRRRQGLPYKRSLRYLSSTYLKHRIQKDVGGHKPEEDASTCMRLMIWKVQEDVPGLWQGATQFKS